MLILTVIQGADKGRVFELPANEPQLLGRSSEALPVTDQAMSRRHAELTPDDGEWWIRDLGSQNGTYVNGVRISGERVQLNPGDQIRAGASLFVFGRATPEIERDLVRIVRPQQMDTAVERMMPSNDDSMILAQPEPGSAAIDHLQVIYRLTTLTSALMDREELLQGVLELIFNEFRPERGVILLGDGDNEQPRPVAVKYRKPPLDKQEKTIHVSRTILQAAMSEGDGVLSSNAMNDPRFAAGDSVQQLNIRSAVCSPIKFRDRIFGAIYIDSSIANYSFTPEQLALMNAIGRHTGLALANAEAYQQKLQTERLAAVGETVASLSHSIKNILQGLRGGADVVEMGLRKNDLKVARGGWGILKRNLDRIMALTLNMLAYSRQRTMEIELTKLGPLLEECAALLSGLCEARQVALLVDCEPDMPPVPIDPHLMHQALMNLMTNAIEAVEARTGAVTVRAIWYGGADNGGRPGTHPRVRISVIDNGPGIEPDLLNRIFEPFMTTKGSRGTGLGLAVTKRIAEAHRGRLEVESRPGEGATFTVDLPADPQVVMDPAATADTRQRREPRARSDLS